MAVNEDLSAYSTTAASNTPGGSTNIGTDLDDQLRDIKKNIGKAVGNSWGPTEPGSGLSARGRLWYDWSGSASEVAVLRINGGGTGWTKLFTINTSATTAYAPANPTDFASTGTTMNAGYGLSGGGSLAANRVYSLANVHTGTIAVTNASVTVDFAGRVIALTAGNAPSAAATDAEVRSGTSSAVYVSPVTLQHGQGVAKFWVNFMASGTASIAGSYNVASVVRSAAGIYTVNFTTAFTDTGYCVTGNSQRGQDNATLRIVQPNDWSLGSCQIHVLNESGDTNVDANRLNIVGYGFQ